MSDDRMDMLPIFTVDAFTKEQFKGNPAAVCLVPHNKEVSKDTKQKIAAEMNLSETAFISILEEKDTFENGKRFGLQWFTPKCEVPLCGHATLASATVLFSACCNDSPILEFETVSGTLTAKKMPDGKIELDLPAYKSKPVDMKKYEHIIKAAVGSVSAAQEIVMSDSGDLLIRLRDDATRSELEALKPDQTELLSAEPKLYGLIITLKADDGEHDFVSRYFAPWLGVYEDPVTVNGTWKRKVKSMLLYRHGILRSELEALKPDQTELLSGPDLNGLIVTLKADDGEHDFVSRYFAPWLGAYEDPVTVNGTWKRKVKSMLLYRHGILRSELEALKPDQTELLSGPDLNGLIVTLKADDGEHDFVSRYFAPWLGVYEDPVTGKESNSHFGTRTKEGVAYQEGAAHCVLAPYWSKVLGKTKLSARQCSPRGGELSLNLKGDRVGISGHSVLVLQGQISF